MRRAFHWRRPAFDRSFGQEVRALDLTRIRVPSLIRADGSIASGDRRSGCSRTRKIGAPSHLLMGPWVHIAHLSQLVADMNYGLFASGRAADISGAHVRFFQRYLDGARPTFHIRTRARANGKLHPTGRRSTTDGPTIWGPTECGAQE